MYSILKNLLKRKANIAEHFDTERARSSRKSPRREKRASFGACPPRNRDRDCNRDCNRNRSRDCD
jgi:hypothetical protein